MALTTIEFVNGIFSVLCITIATIIGLTIALKYFKYKERNLIFVGITWIGIFAPWASSAVSFISALITGSGISDQAYFFIGSFSAVIIVLVWSIAFVDLMNYKGKKRAIIPILTIETGILETLFITFLFTNPSLIGELIDVVDVQYKAFGVLFFVNLMLIYISTTTIFCLKSLRAENPEINLKGKFLLLGSLLFIISAVFDTAISLNLISLTIIRILLMASGVLFYFGFILPDFVKKQFIKSS